MDLNNYQTQRVPSQLLQRHNEARKQHTAVGIPQHTDTSPQVATLAMLLHTAYYMRLHAQAASHTCGVAPGHQTETTTLMKLWPTGVKVRKKLTSQHTTHSSTAFNAAMQHTPGLSFHTNTARVCLCATLVPANVLAVTIQKAQQPVA